MMLFFAHIPFVVNHTINATPPERLQQHPLLFTKNRTDRTFFLWRLHPARPSHPGHSTIFLRSEIPSGMCAKLRTVAASNNRDYPTRSLSSSPFASTINCSPGSQALLEVTHQDHSIGITLLLLVRATYTMVLFFTHIPFVVNHTINATPPERLQQYQLPMINQTLCTVQMLENSCHDWPFPEVLSSVWKLVIMKHKLIRACNH